jgi:hypothetical protein
MVRRLVPGARSGDVPAVVGAGQDGGLACGPGGSACRGPGVVASSAIFGAIGKGLHRYR